MSLDISKIWGPSPRPWEMDDETVVKYALDVLRKFNQEPLPTQAGEAIDRLAGAQYRAGYTAGYKKGLRAGQKKCNEEKTNGTFPG